MAWKAHTCMQVHTSVRDAGPMVPAVSGYWTHNPDGSLPLAQLDRPFPWAIPLTETSIHTYMHSISMRSLKVQILACVMGENTAKRTHLTFKQHMELVQLE